MVEKHIVLEDIDPVMFYGVNNGHLQMLKSLFPKLRIVARDNVVRALGDEEELIRFEEKTEALRRHILKYNAITEEDLIDIINGRKTKAEGSKGVIVYNTSGKPIKSRSENQQLLVEAYEKNDLVFAVGPAGTGKTYLSIALAVKALKEKTAKKIILSRPAVEAGEKLGFLPGDMKEKIDPYLQPLYDAGRHAPRRQTARDDGEARDTNRPTGFYAWTNAERCHRHPRRSSEYYLGAN